MVYAVILSAGKGTRMGQTSLPKQFLSISNKPIVIHTIEKFAYSPLIDKILVMVGEEWVSHTVDIINRYIPYEIKNKIIVSIGGEDRQESVLNSIDYIEKKYGIKKSDIVVTHDAVRPFVSSRIISDNIKMAKIYGATDTVVKTSDTIVESIDSGLITSIPDRNNMYLGQTPQSFNLLKLKTFMNKLTREERLALTDCAKIFVINNENVKLIEGEYSNIKITTQFDFNIANALLSKGELNDK